MIIKCKVGGSLTLSSLGKLTLKGNEIVDLSLLFSQEEIKREMRPPKGCLYNFFKRDLIEKVEQSSSDFIRHQQELKRAEFEQQKQEIKQMGRRIITDYFRKPKNQRIEQIKGMEYVYFDLMLDIKSQERDPDVIYAIFEKMNDFSQQRLMEGFILL